MYKKHKKLKKKTAKKLKKAKKKLEKEEKKYRKVYLRMQYLQYKEQHLLAEINGIGTSSEHQENNELNGIEVLSASKLRAPMTKEEWEKQESIVRRVKDTETGRYR